MASIYTSILYCTYCTREVGTYGKVRCGEVVRIVELLEVCWALVGILRCLLIPTGTLLNFR